MIPLDLSPTALVQGGSGLLYMAVGLVILAVAPRAKAGHALAGHCVAWGTGFVVINFLGKDLLSVGLWARAVTSLAAAACLLWFHSVAPWRPGLSKRAEWAAAFAAIAVGAWSQAWSSIPSHLALAQIGGYDDPLAAQATNAASNVVHAVALFVAGAAALVSPRGRHRTAAGLLAVAVLAYPLYVDFGNVVNPLFDPLPGRGMADRAGMILGVLAVAAAWLRVDGRVAWALLGLGLLSMAVLVFVPGIAGDVGLVRCVAAVLVGVAVLRFDALRSPLSAPTVRRGGLATASLALLFIVAQVAQNFFSAKFGLLSGGIIAGTFLFAASPIQRTFERMSSREPGGAPPRNATKTSKQQEEAFRGAVRLAWKDRRFEQSEELALAVLADSMGLAAARATAIRHEVEREKGVR